MFRMGSSCGQFRVWEKILGLHENQAYLLTNLMDISDWVYSPA